MIWVCRISQIISFQGWLNTLWGPDCRNLNLSDQPEPETLENDLQKAD